MFEKLDQPTQARIAELRRVVRSYGSALVAFSGGVDSTFLSWVAQEQLGDRAAAVTARSETYPQWEYDEAVRLAKRIGIRHYTIETSELAIEGFLNNPPDRCYYCKRELFSKLKELAERLGLRTVAEGANADDAGDFRPGMRATRELGIACPLKEAGLTKQEIRDASREAGLPTWDKPSYACLASRFPYGEGLSREKLDKVGAAEEFLRGLGLSQLRVRHHGDVARIEVTAAEIVRLASDGMREQVVKRMKELGYKYVALDLEGYRTGSMNETLSRVEKERHLTGGGAGHGKTDD